MPFLAAFIIDVYKRQNIYRSATEHSSLNYTAGTSLSYISEKIHQSDENGSVSLGTFDGLDALILEQEYDGASYFTYIYTDEHELKELFVKEGVQADASRGRQILQVKSFEMEAVSAVSYTHLDVYKRQIICSVFLIASIFPDF